MTEDFRRYDAGPGARRRAGAGVGALFLAAAVGVGIGLLAAPETGVKTRRRLRRRLSTLGTDLGEGLEGVQEFGGRARERMRERLATMRRHERELDDDHEEEDEESDEERSSGLGAILAMAAGAAATYFLSSERAAPARTRVRETAETVRRKAGDRWERFQQTRGNGPSRGGEDETPGDVSASDEPPRGS